MALQHTKKLNLIVFFSRYEKTHSTSSNEESSYKPQIDHRLAEWLRERGVTQQAIDIITHEEYNLEDFLGHIQRADLKKMQLR